MLLKIKETTYRVDGLLNCSDKEVKSITGKTKSQLRKEFGIEEPKKVDLKESKKEEAVE